MVYCGGERSVSYEVAEPDEQVMGDLDSAVAFAMNVALAAIALSKGRLFPSFDSSGFERAMDGPLRRIVVTGVGHWRGEGLALVEAVPNGR